MIFNVDTAFFLIPSILGVLGNSLVLFVYSRKNNKHSSTLFIISLAVIDFLASLLGMPYTIVVEELDYQLHSDFSCKFYYFFITCIVPFSVYIMVAIAVDRYICICRPHSHVLTRSRGKMIIIALMTLSVLQGIIPSLFYGVYIETKSLVAYIVDKVGTNQSSKTGYCIDCISNPSNGRTNSNVTIHSYLMTLRTFWLDVCMKDSSHKHTLYTGVCRPNQVILSDGFLRKFQAICSSLYLVCFLIVFVLYIIIYKSVLARRKSRMAAKARINVTQDTYMSECPLKGDSSRREQDFAMEVVQDNSGNEKTYLKSTKLPANNHTKKKSLEGGNENLEDSDVSTSQCPANKSRNKAKSTMEKRSTSCSGGSLREKYYLANIRTAIMLFIVTVIFILTYLPSLLMAHNFIPFNKVVFYCYFINHISNPIIYAFLNPAFRKALRGQLCFNHNTRI